MLKRDARQTRRRAARTAFIRLRIHFSLALNVRLILISSLSSNSEKRMRLINTTTLELAEFVSWEIPAYAILSHRWAVATEELTFKDYRKGVKRDTSGYRKIVRFCQLAASQDWDWGWVDTICIDKRSSAELSESINSMLGWYREAAVCYAYLSDVDKGGNWESSDWWTRGWTLQELIGPEEVLFYDAAWTPIGSKYGLAARIAALTRIPDTVPYFAGHGYGGYLVAQKLSWAAGRRTTRIEDQAYCLLGLFGIHMPLLYGEGDKAFERLQLQILMKCPDDSILAWDPKTDEEGTLDDLTAVAGVVLADSPDRFKRCGQHILSSLQYSRPEIGAIAPRVTSWGIEYRGIAQRLELEEQESMSLGEELNQLLIERVELWAVLLTAIVGEGLIHLPYVLITAVRPASYALSSAAVLSILRPHKALRLARSTLQIRRG
ncbi:unnamed protein product [Zymoseptoria tritici ST99CH_3D1]|nr:unnamed protein product [Zymoseptoria tritici ST99CH_3D1]